MSANYSDGQIQALIHKIRHCNFSSSVLERLLKAAESKESEDRKLDDFENFQFSFYSEALIVNLVGITSFFFNEKDEMLTSLHSTAEQLRKGRV